VGINVSDTSIKVGDRIIDLSSPKVMGILNATPDSFSDGGLFHAEGGSGVFRIALDKILAHAEAMLSNGASIIDVGGESTRPGAQPISEQEEADRVLPVVEAIASRLDVAVSVDTSTPSVMTAAIGLGAGLINDVRALGRVGALEALAQQDAAICLMHMQGQPETMQRNVEYLDVVEEVMAFLRARIDACVELGIARERLILEPGFGFGKTAAHNYQLLRELNRFASLGLPILIGLSRKSMLGAATGRAVDQRLAAGIAATMIGLQHGAAIIRTHDVAQTVDAINVHRCIAGNQTTQG
jgi:dihydropteroate synthase